MLGRLWGCLGLAVLVVALFILHPLLFAAIGQQLVAADELRPADAIIVLAGNAPSRSAHGVELYRQGWAPRVIVADERVKSHGLETTWRVLNEQGIARLDIPADALVVLPRPGEDTHDEAMLSRDMLAERGWTRVILVTDRFHSWRARAIFRAALAPIGVDVRSSPSTFGTDVLREWWKRPDGVEVVFSEYAKFTWALWSQHVRLEDVR